MMDPLHPALQVMLAFGDWSWGCLTCVQVFLETLVVDTVVEHCAVEQSLDSVSFDSLFAGVHTVQSMCSCFICFPGVIGSSHWDFRVYL